MNSAGEAECFEGSFRRAIWPFLVIAQLFGVMPVFGVSNRTLSSLHFEWKSVRTIYSLVTILILLIYSLYLMWRTFTGPVYFNLICEQRRIRVHNYVIFDVIYSKEVICYIFSKSHVFLDECI